MSFEQVSSLAKNVKTPLQRTIGDDNSLCTTIPEPESESVEQQQSRAGQEQSKILPISDLEVVKNHLVWLYMKPNLLRGVGKHLQVILFVFCYTMTMQLNYTMLRSDELSGYTTPHTYRCATTSHH